MRVLVGGIGNVFFGDDGFGVAVAQRLLRDRPSFGGARVLVRDVGIRGLHLAYDLVDGWDLLIAVDAIPSRGAPGTMHVIVPESPSTHVRDAHGMDLASILSTAAAMGAVLPEVLVVGCEVAEVREQIGLSDVVERAVADAARVIEVMIESRVNATLMQEAGQ